MPDFRNDLKDEDDDEWFKPSVGKVVPTASRRLGGVDPNNHSYQDQQVLGRRVMASGTT